MKKFQIGIITHHYIKNYGAFLQAYALQQTLNSLYPDANVEIINYINKKHYYTNLRPLLISKPHSKKIIKAIDIFFEEKRKLLQFYNSKKYLNISSRCSTANDINNKKYDALFIGSDEVWNLNSVSLDKIKFAVDLECNNIISYAPSVGRFSQEQEIPEFVSKGIKNFNRISVRDVQTKQLVEKFFEGSIEMVLDPTLLYDFDKESNLAKTYQQNPYILVYQCQLDKSQINQVKNFAKKSGLIVVGAGYNEDWFDKSLISISPFDWIKLFNRAQFVITGTFHGAIFAIKAKKKFIAYPTLPNRVEKIKFLLNLFDIEQQLLNDTNKNRIIDYLLQDVDYQNVYEKIDDLKTKSIDFIKDSVDMRG